jgi:putative membrane protein
MIVGDGVGFMRALREFLFGNWIAIPLIVTIEYVVTNRALYWTILDKSVFSAPSVSMLATVVGIFLVFRFNEAYERWWEARKLWGQMVNASRKWGRQITTLLTADRIGVDPGEQKLQAIRRRLIKRHIAYVNALRLRLRQQECNEQVSGNLEHEEFEALRRCANLPTQLIERQASELADLIGADPSSQLLLMQLDDTLNELYDVQGGCERIKTTVFPASVTFIAHIFVWGIVVLIPIVFLDHEEATTILEMAAVGFICLSYLVVGQLAALLKNPFEGLPNDTPMTALCRTIEIDLLEQLGETELPDPIEPENGILM